MLDDYLNQIATLKRYQSMDAYGKPVFTKTYFLNNSQPIEIECIYEMPVRWIGKRKVVRNSQGEEVVCEATVLSLFEPTLNDRIIYKEREWPIISISDIVNLDGDTEYWKVFV